MRKVIFSAVAVVAAGLLIACGAGAGSDNESPFKTDEPIRSAQQDQPDYPEPKAGDFTLATKILEKRCFGSAGCNVTFRVEVSYDGPDLDPTRTYEVTYEVKGGEDQFIGTLTVTGDQYSTRDEQRIGTESEAAQLNVVILEME